MSSGRICLKDWSNKTTERVIKPHFLMQVERIQRSKRQNAYKVREFTKPGCYKQKGLWTEYPWSGTVLHSPISLSVHKQFFFHSWGSWGYRLGVLIFDITAGFRWKKQLRHIHIWIVITREARCGGRRFNSFRNAGCKLSECFMDLASANWSFKTNTERVRMSVEINLLEFRSPVICISWEISVCTEISINISKIYKSTNHNRNHIGLRVPSRFTPTRMMAMAVHQNWWNRKWWPKCPK